MSSADILNELKQLTNTERLAVIEAATRLIREELRQQGRSSVEEEQHQRLAAAAEALLPDYTSDEELTAFASLDGEDFRHA